MTATNVIPFPTAPAREAPRERVDFSEGCTMVLLLGWLAMSVAVLTASF